MPSWLPGTRGPLVLLCIYALVLGVVHGLVPDGMLSGRAEAISSLLHPMLIAWWVVADAAKRRRTLFYDYASFVFFAWPVVVPIYLFQTRKARALLTIACFIGIWLASLLVGSVIAMALGAEE